MIRNNNNSVIVSVNDNRKTVNSIFRKFKKGTGEKPIPTLIDVETFIGGWNAIEYHVKFTDGEEITVRPNFKKMTLKDRLIRRWDWWRECLDSTSAKLNIRINFARFDEITFNNLTISEKDFDMLKILAKDKILRDILNVFIKIREDNEKS